MPIPRRSPTQSGGPVQLGAVLEGGLAPAILAMVERGVHRRPALAEALRAEVELAAAGHPPVRIVFGSDEVLVEDGPAATPDLRIAGSLADLISLMVAPLVGGVPSPMRPRGRAALGMLAAPAGAVRRAAVADPAVPDPDPRVTARSSTSSRTPKPVAPLPAKYGRGTSYGGAGDVEVGPRHLAGEVVQELGAGRSACASRRSVRFVSWA